MSATVEELNIATLEWRNALMGNTIKVGILTVLLGLVLAVFFIFGLIREISENWPRYRCAPYVMPFADFYGYDSAENMNFCLQTIFREKGGDVLAPIYDILAKFSASMAIMVNSVNSFRTLMSNFILSTNNFVRQVRDKIQTLFFQVRMNLMKMQYLMGRVYGTMYSIVWMGYSSITAGLNLADNDLVSFLFEFCFAPNTRLRRADGELCEIREVRVGDMLEGGVRVTSVLMFDGSRTPMVQIGEDVLSSQHFIQMPSGGPWRPALHHPDATPVPSLSHLICLNVEGHRFTLASGLTVADYDETDSVTAAAAAQAIAEAALNGGSQASGHASGQPEPVADYSLGIDPALEVQLADTTWKSLGHIRVGDRLQGGAVVLGTVEEACADVRTLLGQFHVAAAQLVFLHKTYNAFTGAPILGGSWVRAAHVLGSEEGKPATLRHLVLSNTSPFEVRHPVTKLRMWMRDYREAPLPDMEAPYAEALTEA